MGAFLFPSIRLRESLVNYLLQKFSFGKASSPPALSPLLPYTRGLLKKSFVSLIKVHALLYDIDIAYAAVLMDTVSAINLRSSAFPGTNTLLVPLSKRNFGTKRGVSDFMTYYSKNNTIFKIGI
jgi:hypothetical protein